MPRSFLGALVGLALLVSGVLGLTVGSSQPSRGPSLKAPIGLTSLEADAVSPSETGAASPAVPAETSTSSPQSASPQVVTPLADFLARSRPVRVEIPRIDLSVGLMSLGLNDDGTVQVPSDPARAGWFDGGASPGERGSAVLLGHVDSKAGPAVFFRLDELRPGDVITVTRADDVKVEFRVIGLRQYAKDAFPNEDVYGTRDYAALQLVTCGGLFNPSSGHYLSNVVVYSVMTAWQPA